MRVRVQEELVTKLTLKLDFFDSLLQFVVDDWFFLKNFAASWSRTPIATPLQPVINTLCAKEFITHVTTAALSHVE